MHHQVCGVLGCQDPILPFHSFPSKDKSRLKLWVIACGNEKLASLSASLIVHRVICHKHFASQYILRSGKLARTAVPTLHLPVPLQELPPNYLQEISTGLNIEAEVPSADITVEVFFDEYNLQNVESLEVASQTSPLKRYFESVPSTSRDTGEYFEPDVSQQDLACKYQPKKELCTPVQQIGTARKVSNKGSVLQVGNVRRCLQLTPKVKSFYKQLVKVKKIVDKKTVLGTVRSRLLETEKCLSEETWQIDKLSKVIGSQIRNLKVKKFHGKYKIEDKIFALALFKQNPKAYRFFSKLFCLPRPRTLQQVVLHVPIKPGICEPVFERFKSIIKNMPEKQRCCSLVFNEMPLQPGVNFSPFEDVNGYLDHGLNRNEDVVDHALVWMLRSVSCQQSWKQPVAYSFVKGCSKWEDIVMMLKLIIRKCHSVGLKVVATVCNQRTANVKAINELLRETKANALRLKRIEQNNIFKIDEQVIVPLFDPPHLLKSFRNHLLTKNLIFKIDNVQYIAKWSHIVDAYRVDCASGKFRIMKNLTDSHVIPSKIKKMKVSAASQVFSSSVASGVMLMSNCSASALGHKVLSEAKHTALLVDFMDSLFDSVNCGILAHKRPKKLRSKISTTGSCPQEYFWNKAIKVFNTMQFVKHKSSDQTRPVVLKNWIFTLENFKLLRKTMRDIGFEKFAGRAFNQDFLENYFGQVRIQNINPTCSTFNTYFKSLLLNDFPRSHSPSANCEDDGTSGLLFTLKNFVSQEMPEPKES